MPISFLCTFADRSFSGELEKAKAFKIDEKSTQGIVSCSWPGRFQVLTRKFIHGTHTFYLDGAHTRESIELCAQWFNDLTDGIVSR